MKKSSKFCENKLLTSGNFHYRKFKVGETDKITKSSVQNQEKFL